MSEAILATFTLIVMLIYFNKVKPKPPPRLLVTNGMKPPDLSGAIKIGTGDWAEVFLKDNKVIRAIYRQDSTMDTLKEMVNSSAVQNQARAAKIAPRVYSVGMRSDGRIYQVQQYLKDYRPIHDTNIDPRQLEILKRKLARNNISHNEINSGNILVNSRGRVKLVDFDTAAIKEGGSQGDRDLIDRIGNLYKN